MRLVTKILLLFTLMLLQLTGCFRSIPYPPAQLAVFSQRPENLQLDFETDKGRQVAFYLPPLNSPERPPKRIAILYPGIESLALDWLRFIDLAKDPDLAYLLIDYPGRGFCEGLMRPSTLYRSTEGALTTLAGHWGQERLDAEIDLMGHSFGTGAALQFAARHPVRRIVLVAPFNTLSQAMAQKSWLFSLLVPAEIDNRELIRTLLASENPPDIAIFHGDRDTSLPVTMGKELAALAPERIAFHEFPDDDHVDILKRRWPLIFAAIDGETD